ncbi:MAG: division/cell wall cluster transcriptional repressor MraZ [Planctomycetota bacterium]
MLLTGTFARSLDEKLRVPVPKQLREPLCEANSPLYLTPGTDQSLALYTEETLTRLAERLAQASPNRQDVRAYQRLFYAQAQRVEIDGQGRLRVPPELAAVAAMEKEVVLLGVHDHVEIWAADRWQEYQAASQADFDHLAETAFDPGRTSAGA